MPGNVPNDREDPRDANPMYKRLPAEVVSRRRHHEVVSTDGEDLVSVDRKAVFVLKPEQRLKWLAKALRQVEEGRLRPSDLYDVVSSSRFADNIPPKVGKKMGKALREQIGVFTGKQQKFLSEQAEITARFGAQPAKASSVPVSDSATPVSKEGDAGGNNIDVDEMMARCRAFVRDKQRERGERVDGEEEPVAMPVAPTEPAVPEQPAVQAAPAVPGPAATTTHAAAEAVAANAAPVTTVAAVATAAAAPITAAATPEAGASLAKAAVDGLCKRGKSGRSHSRSHERSRSRDRSRSRSNRQKLKSKKEAEKKQADRRDADKRRDGRREKEGDRTRGRSPASSSSSSSSRERKRRKGSVKKKRPVKRGSSESTSSTASQPQRRHSKRPSEREKKQQGRKRSVSSSEQSKHRGSKSKKARR